MRPEPERRRGRLRRGLLLMQALLLATALVVAFLNGANDNFKGVATLHGAGTLSYRGALVLGTALTAVGGVLSLALAGALLKAFTGKGLVPDAALTGPFRVAVGLGAAATLLLATRLGFPVSTTHALVGGLVGAGLVSAGGELHLAALGGAFVLPLLAGPLVATALGFALAGAFRRRAAAAASAGAASGGRAGTAAHVASGALVSLARGVNDTPKILALVAGAGAVGLASGTALVTLAMAAGGLLAAARVAHTLAHRITPMAPQTGLAGNLTAATLVLAASPLGLPLSTTHVATGGIFGLGASGRSLRSDAVRNILAAWVVTLPVAAALAAAGAWALA